jgi:hypothetical protein
MNFLRAVLPAIAAGCLLAVSPVSLAFAEPPPPPSEAPGTPGGEALGPFTNEARLMFFAQMYKESAGQPPDQIRGHYQDKLAKLRGVPEFQRKSISSSFVVQWNALQSYQKAHIKHDAAAYLAIVENTPPATPPAGPDHP